MLCEACGGLEFTYLKFSLCVTFLRVEAWRRVYGMRLACLDSGLQKLVQVIVGVRIADW